MPTQQEPPRVSEIFDMLVNEIEKEEPPTFQPAEQPEKPEPLFTERSVTTKGDEGASSKGPIRVSKEERRLRRGEQAVKIPAKPAA